MTQFVTAQQPIIGEYDFAFAAIKWNISGDNYGTVIVSLYSENVFVGAHLLNSGSPNWPFGPFENADGSKLSGSLALVVPTTTQLGTLTVKCDFTPSGQKKPTSYSRTLVAWDVNGNTLS